MTPYPEFLKVPEVADMLRVSNSTVQRMIRDGRLTAERFGSPPRCVRIRADALRALLERDNEGEDRETG